MKKVLRYIAIGSFTLSVALFLVSFVLSMAGYSGPGAEEPGPDYLVRTLAWAAVWGAISAFCFLSSPE